MFGDLQLCLSFYKTYRLLLTHGRYNPPTTEWLPCFRHLEDVFSIVEKLMDICVREKKLVMLSNPFNCVWVGIPSTDDVYVLGPAFLGNVTEQQFLDGVCREAKCNGVIPDVEELKREYSLIPTIGFQTLQKHLFFLSGLLCKGGASTDNLLITNTLPNNIMPKQNEEDIYKIQTRDFSTAIQAERYIQHCVRTGDIERIKHMPTNLNTAFPGNIGSDELRQSKNAGIVLLSLTTRSALEGGIPVETAFPLSDAYIMQLEQMSDVAAINNLLQNAMYDFTQRVREKCTTPQYSPLISQCCGFIIANINRSLKLRDVANHVGMNPESLSRRFVKETGVSLPAFIADKKIEEAKILLALTNKTSVEISNLLGFSTQSQFIVTFKRIVGKTPMEYRQTCF